MLESSTCHNRFVEGELEYFSCVSLMEKNLAGCKEVTKVQTLDLYDLSRKNTDFLNPQIKQLAEPHFSCLHHGVIPSFLCVFQKLPQLRHQPLFPMSCSSRMLLGHKSHGMPRCQLMPIGHETSRWLLWQVGFLLPYKG